MYEQAFGEESAIKMAFIIVKKRISTRFFSKQTEGMLNPPPGTVVDSVVTNPSM